MIKKERHVKAPDGTLLPIIAPNAVANFMEDLAKKVMQPESKTQGLRNAPLWLDTTASCDLTEYPIKITLAVPTLLFKSLRTTKIETDKVIVVFKEVK